MSSMSATYSHHRVDTSASIHASTSGELPILSQLDSYVKTLSEAGPRDDVKLKVLQDISSNFEILSAQQTFPTLMDHLLRVFMRLLQETVPQFIGENNTQQLRKLMLEMIHRMPCNEFFKQFAKNINSLMLKIVQSENEENVLVALRIIIELQKQFRPQYSSEVQQFLSFCKSLYRDLPLHLSTIFEPRSPIRVGEIQDLNIEEALRTAYSVTPIHTEQKLQDSTTVVYTLLPRGTQSLKVLAELPIIVVLLYQIHKTSVQQDIADFIPLILNTISLSPTPNLRSHPNFNRELFVEFLSSQVKALSFLAFLARMFLTNFQDLVNMHSGPLVKGIIQMLELCPPEVTHLRRELLVGTRHLLASDLRSKFVSYLPQFFNESLVIGSGWTANETLRPLVYSMLADLVHHVRTQLTLQSLATSVHLFARCIHDPTLPAYVQAMCCKLMLNLVECIVNQTQRSQELSEAARRSLKKTVRQLLLYMLEVFIRKFKVVSIHHIPAIMDKFDPVTLQLKVPAQSQTQTATQSKSEQSCVEPEKECGTETADNQQSEVSTNADDSSESLGTETRTDTDTDGSPTAVARQQTQDTSNKKTAAQIGMVYWGIGSGAMNISDCRSLVKVLVGGVKTCVWGIGNARNTNQAAPADPTPMKVMSGTETAIFVRLLKYGLQCLDIYTICSPQNHAGQYARSAPSSPVRSKEEKEALDHFASVFTYLNVQNFKEIFSTNIGSMVDRISSNYALQLICNYFLVTPHTSAGFGSILVQYLLERLPEMGCTNSDRATLYLKLFKLVFNSVSMSGQLGLHGENEQMLKPHLHTMVHRAMEHALVAREPGNYFLLLRQLFRSIGGGSHDLLYQEFLPLLPALLQKLNRLQSSAHRQQMRELFVELCLTVPVRLSSLLPYLPLLMDPLVCALNGSPTLVQQGLRTLELCVDNLQPEYLYEHMAPVRAPLMHGLWRTVGAADDSAAANIAFRILGKFGGSNRKMLADPQQLTFTQESETAGPSVVLVFGKLGSGGLNLNAPTVERPPGNIEANMPLAVALNAAYDYLHSPTSDSQLRLYSWTLIKSMLLSTFKNETNDMDSSCEKLINILEEKRSCDSLEMMSSKQPIYKFADETIRNVYVQALTAMFFAVWSKDLRPEVLHFFNAFVRNLTLQAIIDQTGPEVPSVEEYYRLTHLDSAVLVDAIANALADSAKEYCHSAVLAMTLIKDTLINVLGSLEKACQLSYIEYLLERICKLCYENAWYARLGGCAGINFLLEHMPQKWIQKNAIYILRSLIEVVMGQFGEVSHGALDMATGGMKSLLQVVCADKETQDKELITDILREMVPHMLSPNTFLRDQCVTMCDNISEFSNFPISVLHSLIKKDLEKIINEAEIHFKSMSVACQIGFMQAFAYWHSLEPQLLTFDLDDSVQKDFSDELIYLCETDEAQLKKRPVYEQMVLASHTSGSVPIANFSSLKLASLKALTACYISGNTKPNSEGESETTERDRLFLVVLKALTHGETELQSEAFECLKTAMSRVPMDRNLLHGAMRPVLLNLSEYKQIQLKVAKRLLHLTRLSPNTFNEKFCDQILVHLKKWVDAAVQSQPGSKGAQPFITPEMEAPAVILDIVHQIPAASARLIDQIVPIISKGETQLSVEPGSNWRTPLLKFLVRYPIETVNYFVQDESLSDESCRSLFLWIIKQPDGGPCRQVFIQNPNLVSNLLRGHSLKSDDAFSASDNVPKQLLEYFALRLICALMKRKPEFVRNSASLLVDQLRALWRGIEYAQRQGRQESNSIDNWKLQAPKLVIKCLLGYFKFDSNNIDLLFESVRCFSRKPTADFSLVRNFLENDLIPNYSIKWRRLAFMRFVEMYSQDDTTADSVKVEAQVKVLQYVILPCLHYSLEHGDRDTLIGTSPAPDQDSDENLVSLWVCKVIDHAKSKAQLPDALHILLYQQSCLFVEYAPQHIHDSSSKKQGSRLRKFMLFAWPCLQQTSSQDPTTKYHGHLLIAHIIDKFAINRKIVLQVFHSLLKAHGQDPRGVIRQALTILTPAVPQRMEDGHLQLVQFAKKIITEEGHVPAQLVHLMQLIVRHYKVYFPVRRQLTQYLMSGIQKLVTNHGTLENRRLAVEVCEMIIKWELYRLKENQEAHASLSVSDPEIYNLLMSPQPANQSSPEKKFEATPGPSVEKQTTPLLDTQSAIDKVHVDQVVNILVRMASQPEKKFDGATPGPSVENQTTPLLDTQSAIDKVHVDQVVNILVRMASQVPEQVTGNNPTQNVQNAEALNKRSLQLLKVALKPDIWGNIATVKLLFLDKVLSVADQTYQNQQQQQSTPQVHICLDVLTFLVGVLPKDQVVQTIRPIQRGISACLSSSVSQVVRSLYQLLTRLLSVMKTSENGMIELEVLNASIIKFLQDILSGYEKTSGSVNSLFGAMTVLRAMCTPQPAFLDRFMSEMLKTLIKLVREHTTPIQPETIKTAADIISLCLELIRPRLDGLKSDQQKQLLQNILIPLIEKSSSARVVGTIIKMADDWIHAAEKIDGQLTSLRERQVLLIKLMHYLERRFSTDAELSKQFLTTVLYVYSTPAVRSGDICAKLEPAFHQGLAHSDQEFAQQFFTVYDKSIAKDPYERLWYIVSMQNWMAMKQNYWIRQCIRLILSAVDHNASLTMAGPIVFKQILPLTSEDVEMDEIPKVKMERLSSTESMSGPEANGQQQIRSMVEKQKKFLTEASALTMSSLVDALSALCHADSNLAEKVWILMLPSVWNALTAEQTENLTKELIPFLASGSHVVQKDAKLSTINTFVEALARCQPSVHIKPQLLKYLGSTHNLWHRAILLLEQQAVVLPSQISQPKFYSTAENETAQESLDILDCLASLYQSLSEVDMWSCVWTKRASYPETVKVLSFCQQGDFGKSVKVLESAMGKTQLELAAASGQAASTGINMNVIAEMNLWEEEWVRCTKELNQWDVLKDFSNNNAIQDPLLLMECAWRKPDLQLMKDAITQLEASCPVDSGWLMHLYRGYWFVSQQLEDTQQQQREVATAVDRCKEQANNCLIEIWRNLPKLVSHSHVPVLQGAHRVQELAEASQVSNSMSNPMNVNSQGSLINDIKSIVKTWRNRSPTLSDPLSHWYDIYTWRLHHYMSMLNLFESYESQQQQALLPIHSCAQCLIQLSKVARKHGQLEISLTELHKLHTIANLPIMDSFVKLYQQIKCYVRASETTLRPSETQEALMDALELIESTNISYFNKEQSSKLYALKGNLLSRLEKPDDAANKAFSASLQLHDTLHRAWALWGEHLQSLFIGDYKRKPTDRMCLSNGLNGLVCFLEAGRQETEVKARKHLARALWLLKCLTQTLKSHKELALTRKQLMQSLTKYGILVPAANWLPWLPHLLLQLKSSPSNGLCELIRYIAQAYPQTLYFHIRKMLPDGIPSKMHEELKKKAKEKEKSADLKDEDDDEPRQIYKDDSPSVKSWNHYLAEILFEMHQTRPCDMRALDTIFNELSSLCEHWSETSLRNIRSVVSKCCTLLFSNRNQVHCAQTTPELEKMLKQLVDTVKGNPRKDKKVTQKCAWSATEYPLRASLAEQMTADLELNTSSNTQRRRLQPLLAILVKWQKTIEAKVNQLPKRQYLRDQSPLLASFSSQVANVHVPGETQVSKTTHYCAEIARFSPHIEMVRKSNNTCRRIQIRAHNGKLFTFLLERATDADSLDRQERVLQLFRMTNLLLTKERETSRRLLQLHCPRFIPFGHKFQLIESNPSTMSLLDILTEILAEKDTCPSALLCTYYEKLSTSWSSGVQPSHNMLKQILQEVNGLILPKDSMKKYLEKRFPNATDYYAFRKQLCTHLSLLGLYEFVFHLTWVNVDQLNVQLGTGCAHTSQGNFDLHAVTGDLDSNRAVPFRLSPCVNNVLSWCVQGQMVPSMMAAARCLDRSWLLALLRPTLTDEYTQWKTVDDKHLIDRVEKAVKAITTRLKNLSNTDTSQAKVRTLVNEAGTVDNLCRMDPAWHPWF